MYTEKVMDHFEHPRNVGELENPSGVGTVGNPKCGDIMRIYLDIDENQIIRDVKFKTFGCGAAVATSSMATELVKGKTVQEGLQLKFSYIGEEKEFFRAAFRYDRQNSLREHDFQLIFRFYQDLIQLKTGAPASDDIRFLLEMYCHGSISMTIEWVLSGMATSPEDLARLMVEAMPAKLADLFASFGILTE